MKYLGIDFGSKRVGVAVSDDTGRMAFPYSVISNDAHSTNLTSSLKSSSGQAKLLDQVVEIIEKEKIEAIVIGESKNYAGEPNEIMVEIEKFKKALEDLSVREGKLKVFLEPEFMTSAQAKQITGENEMHDASAAAIILQSYLDKNNI
jgi:putative holliday junction resolvase